MFGLSPDARLTVEERARNRLGRPPWYARFSLARATLALALLWFIALVAAWDHHAKMAECEAMARAPEISLGHLIPKVESLEYAPNQWLIEVGTQVQPFYSYRDPLQLGFEVGQSLRVECLRGAPVSIADDQGHSLRSYEHPSEQAASDGALVFVLGAAGALVTLLAAIARRARAL